MLKKIGLLFLICFVIFASCSGKSKEVMFNVEGIDKNITLKDFLSLKKQPDKQEKLINKLNRKSRQKFLKEFFKLLNLPIDHNLSMIFVKNDKIIIYNNEEPDDSLLFGKLSYDEVSIVMDFRKLDKYIIKELGFKNVVVNDIWFKFVVENPGDKKFERKYLLVFFKIKKISGTPKGDPLYKYPEIKKGYLRFIYESHGLNYVSDKINDYCRKNKCE